MKNRVLVTGADGMLGSHIVRELLARQYEVRAFIQQGRRPLTLKGLDIEIVTGDVLDLENVEAAMQDCSYVIHAAASTSIWPARDRKVYDINLEGTMNITGAAKKQRIRRLVYVSSASVFAPGNKNQPGDEKGAFSGFNYGLDYIDSKYDAQKVVMKAVHYGLNAVIVNPTFMLGAYDSKPGSGSVIIAVSKGKLLATPPGGKNFICVNDVAFAICNALKMGRKGECYILGNQNLPYKDFINIVSGVVNCKPPRFCLPASCIKIMGSVTCFIARLGHKQPLISKQVACMSCDQHFFTSAKAVKELRLPQTPIRQGISEAYSWFQNNGYV